MKKIMFNDCYDLTQAVLEGSKTMTRRLVNEKNIVQVKTSDGVVHHVYKIIGSYHEYIGKDGKKWIAWSPFKIGEIVAVAQSYYTIKDSHVNDIQTWSNIVANTYDGEPGCYNKMFVRAYLMPHQIKITDVKLERLQDISDEDCLKEGVVEKEVDGICYTVGNFLLYDRIKRMRAFNTPRDAFAALIDKISGKGTWNSNPFCFCYEFKLIK